MNQDVCGNHTSLIREIGSAGAVLLKNKGNVLLLEHPKNIAIFGNNAGDMTQGQYFLNLATDLIDTGNTKFGTLLVSGGSGTGRFTYVVTPLEAIKARAQRDGALVQYFLDNANLT